MSFILIKNACRPLAVLVADSSIPLPYTSTTCAFWQGKSGAWCIWKIHEKEMTRLWCPETDKKKNMYWGRNALYCRNMDECRTKPSFSSKTSALSSATTVSGGVLLVYSELRCRAFWGVEFMPLPGKQDLNTREKTPSFNGFGINFLLSKQPHHRRSRKQGSFFKECFWSISTMKVCKVGAFFFFFFNICF